MSTKMYNLRFTGAHEKTKKDVLQLSKEYNVIAAAYEDIAWQNNKIEKPHVHVLIATTQSHKTLKKYINEELKYSGNEQYKIGRPVYNLEKCVQYLFKGKPNDISNIVTDRYTDEEIKKYNQAFWKEKIENDEKYKIKRQGVNQSIMQKLMNPENIVDETQHLSLRKIFKIVLDEYKVRKMRHSDHVVCGYINLACNLYDQESEIERLCQSYYRFGQEFPVIKIENKNLKTKMEYYFKDGETTEDNSSEGSNTASL